MALLGGEQVRVLSALNALLVDLFAAGESGRECVGEVDDAGDVFVDCAGESCGIQFLKLQVLRVGGDIADDTGRASLDGDQARFLQGGSERSSLGRSLGIEMVSPFLIWLTLVIFFE
ncbi:hypothetical protein RCH11_000585 [Glaciihabitans sp. GrIS 2.15]|nr:hypothetical protein [Glaciihabitans sp. GrIS 2.15]